jgi:hypothetical protein
MMRLRSDGIDGEKEVVRCYTACYVGRQRQDTRNSFGGGGVFKDNAKIWKISGEFAEVGEKVFLGVQY